MNRLLAKTLTVVAITLGILTSSVTPALAADFNEGATASAAPATSSDSSATASAAPYLIPTAIESGYKPQDTDIYLATARWRDASTQFHGRYDQFLQTDIIAASQRQFLQATGMGAGNLVYNISTSLLTFALEMEPLNALGAQVDNASGQIGAALFGSAGGASGSVVGFVVIAVVAVTIFRLRRAGAKPWRKILTLVGIVALFAIMVSGAQASTSDGGGNFVPGFMSPGWFATKINSTVSTVAAVPAASFLNLTAGSGGLAAPAGTGCGTYMTQLNHMYYANTATSASVPQIVSSMWETSGLTVWKQAQYGTKTYAPGKTYGDNVFCHQLDWQAGVSAKDQASMTFGGLIEASRAKFNPSSAAWGPDSNDEQDRSLVAWAACDVHADGSMAVRPGFDTTKIKTTSCDNWWQNSTVPGEFNVGGAADNAKDLGTTDDAKGFIQSLHGNDTGPGQILVGTYVVASILVGFVFIGLGLAVTVAKFASLVMMLATFFILMQSVISGNTSKLLGFVKGYLGYTVLAFGATIILSIIALTSSIISKIGVSVFGAGSVMSLIWTGLSPILAAIILHLIFTKLLKMPSMFKPSSAMAWGAASGAIGAAGAGKWMKKRERQIGRAAGGAARAGANRVTNGGYDKLTGAGRKGRKGQMVPKQKGTVVPVPTGGGKGGPIVVPLVPISKHGNGGEAVPGQEKIFGRRDSSNIGDVREAAAALAAGQKPNFNPRVLRDARAFARGIDPTNVPAGRFPRVAQSTALIGGAAVRRGRALSADVWANRGKIIPGTKTALQNGMRAVAGSAAATGGAIRSKYREAVYDPRGALAGTASMAMRGIKSGSRAAYGATLATSKFVRTNEAAQVGLKVARRAAVGMVLGGPVGAAIGGASAYRDVARVGAQTGRNVIGSVRQTIAESDAKKIEAYAASFEPAAAPTARPEVQAAPIARPQKPVLESAGFEPVNGKYTPEQWAIMDEETRQRDRDIVDRANVENREIAELNRKFREQQDQARAAAAPAPRPTAPRPTTPAVPRAVANPFAVPTTVSPRNTILNGVPDVGLRTAAAPARRVVNASPAAPRPTTARPALPPAAPRR